MFGTKDKLMLKSKIVYEFKCAECNSVYVGYTNGHYQTRVYEHLKTDNNSHILKHLRHSTKCKSACNESCFKVIDRARTEYELRIKEAMHIQWIAPSINKQKKSLQMTLII